MAQRAFLSKDGQWPMFLTAYEGRGALWGVLNLTNLPECDFNGTVSWFRPRRTSEEHVLLVTYPAIKIDNGLQVIGSLYSVTNGVPILSLSDSNLVVELANGDLTHSLINPFLFEATAIP